MFVVPGLFIVIVIVSGVLDLPVEKTDDLHVKIQLLKFLSRINEGENLSEKNMNAFIMTHHIFKKCLLFGGLV